MCGEQNDVVLGVKTFFVAPELSLVPEDFLKSFFMNGFETYFLDDDPYCALQDKIKVLFSLFPEVILFFNIDRQVHGIDWPVFIGNLQTTYKERAMIGVLYRKKNNQDEIKRLERLYLYDIGIVCGCVPIEYQKAKNLYLLMNVLSANQANGQRKFLRAICDDSCKVNMEHQGSRYQGVVRDISISHFSCVFIGIIPDLVMHQKISDIQMNLKGVICKITGILCLKRILGNDHIHVFIFRNADDRDGLKAEHLVKINNLIVSSYTNSVNTLLKTEFEKKRTTLSKRISVSAGEIQIVNPVCEPLEELQELTAE